jgi:hypothetical protein
MRVNRSVMGTTARSAAEPHASAPAREGEPASRSVIENRAAGRDLADVRIGTISGYTTARQHRSAANPHGRGAFQRSRYPRQMRVASTTRRIDGDPGLCSEIVAGHGQLVAVLKTAAVQKPAAQPASVGHRSQVTLWRTAESR